MKRRKILWLTFGILLISHAFSEEALISLTVNTGHKGSVPAIAYSEKNDYLFSAGDDGFVKIWDSATGNLVSDIHITNLSIRSITLNEANSQFAVLETNGTSVFRISAWDWKRSERLFILELDEYPLYLGYSPKGSYLIYSKTDWNSVTFLESTTGRKLPYLSQGFGIVSFLTVSDAENTVITYGTSGTISYWDLKTSKLRYQFKTLPNLSAFSINATKRYMAATDGQRLLYIDLTKDNKYVQIFQANITKTEINPKTGAIACYSGRRETGDIDISFWDFYSERLHPQQTMASLRATELVDFRMNDRFLYASLPGGRMRRFDLMTEAVFEYPENLLADIYGLSVYGNTVFLDAGKSIMMFESDFFSATGSGNPEKTVDFGTSFFMNPLAGPVNFLPLRRNEYILWTQGGSQGELVRYDLELQRTMSRPIQFGTSLRDVKYFGDSIGVLDSGGVCRVFDLPDLNPTFEYSSPMLRSLAMVADRKLLLGQNSINRSGFPLLHVDVLTGETVPIADPSLMIFRFENDFVNERLFSLGLERRDDVLYTVLKVHRGPAYENGISLFSFRGEDLNASMVYDGERNSLYTTLGADVIRVWTGTNLLSFEKSEHIPEKLFIHGNFIFTTNRDGTASMWNKSTGKKLLDFFLLKNGYWIALFNDHTFTSSPGGEKYVNAYRKLAPISNDGRKRTIDPALNRGTDSYLPY